LDRFQAASDAVQPRWKPPQADLDVTLDKQSHRSVEASRGRRASIDRRAFGVVLVYVAER
jgi:hypothetical protein